MSNIDKMVGRFLGWKLPDDFGPDAGTTFNPGHITPSSPHWPTGTNLLTAAQARQMFEHVTADEPARHSRGAKHRPRPRPRCSRTPAPLSPPCRIMAPRPRPLS